ncbi:MAG: aspartate carbamoyltransferase catalytic subunit [Acidobacteriota bacterium]
MTDRADAARDAKKEVPFHHKHLLGIADLERAEIEYLLSLAESFKEISTRPIKKVPTLRGRTVVNLFFEPSTRTLSSFDIAEKRLSADTLNFSSSSSSVVKGETLIDTAKNLQAMAPDIIVIRHKAAGAPHLLSRNIDAAIINAGDGAHEHPTQALLDAFTIKERKRRIAGLRVVIVGDILHSRVARSNIHLLTKLGARVIVAGPLSLMPLEIERLGVTVAPRIEDALKDADVVMMLRIQLERAAGKGVPSLREYFTFFGLTRARMALCKPDAIIMHPGPMNRGVEIDSEVADGPYSVILEQVTNGVAVRMAVLYVLSGGRSDEPLD